PTPGRVRWHLERAGSVESQDPHVVGELRERRIPRKARLDRLRARTCQRSLRREQVEQAPGARFVASERYLLGFGGAREQVPARAHLLRRRAEGVVGVEHLVDDLLLKALRAQRGRVGGRGGGLHVIDL